MFPFSSFYSFKAKVWYTHLGMYLTIKQSQVKSAFFAHAMLTDYTEHAKSHKNELQERFPNFLYIILVE